MAPSFEEAAELFRHFGADLVSQRLDDWSGHSDLPSDVQRMYLELGPVDVEIPALGNPVLVPALRNLWEMQIGYRVHALTGEALPSWPAELLVLAQQGGDPVAVEMTTSTVVAGRAGAGSWRFEPFASSLQSAVYALGLLGSIVDAESDRLFGDDDAVDPDQSGRVFEHVANRVGRDDALQMLTWLGWLS